MKLKKVAVALLKIIGLVLLISVERVIYLPFLFILFGLVWLDQVEDSFYAYLLLLLFLSFVLAATYNVLWPVSFLVWAVTSLLTSLTTDVIKSKNKRFFIMTIAQVIFWLWRTQIVLTYLSLIQFIVSYLVVLLWMRLLQPKFNKQTVKHTI